MSVTTLQGALDALNGRVVPATAELNLWNALGKTTTANTVTTKVGLFGHDLAAFLKDCTALGSACDVANYKDFSGWAIGVNWSSTAAPTNAADGVAFKESKETVQVTWGTTSAAANNVQSGVSSAVPAAGAPTTSQVTLAVADDAFGAWGAKAKVLSDNGQFAFLFLKEGAAFYPEAGAKTSIWATAGAVASPANVETADFVLVGAASLTAATSVIVASLLF